MESKIVQDSATKEAQVRATINQKLVESGEKERLKELLRAKLVECGWRDELKAYCKGEEDLARAEYKILSTFYRCNSLVLHNIY